MLVEHNLTCSAPDYINSGWKIIRYYFDPSVTQPRWCSQYGALLRTGRSTIQIPARSKEFSFLQNRSDRLWCPPSLLFVLIPRAHKTDPSPPSTAGNKNEWSCTSPPPIRFHCVDRAILPLPLSIDLKLQCMCVSPQAALRPAEYCSRQCLDCSANKFQRSKRISNHNQHTSVNIFIYKPTFILWIYLINIFIKLCWLWFEILLDLCDW
jgi:hypothetical protein